MSAVGARADPVPQRLATAGDRGHILGVPISFLFAQLNEQKLMPAKRVSPECEERPETIDLAGSTTRSWTRTSITTY